MTVSHDARTPSASVHALSGSTQPGAAQTALAPLATVHELPDTFTSLGTAATGVVAGLAARRAAAFHPDAEVIDLAGRAEALAKRDQVLGPKVQRLADHVKAAFPPPPFPVSNETYHAYHDAIRPTEERIGLVHLRKIRRRMSERLDRWNRRLATMEPRTLPGLAAKAAVCLAISEEDRIDGLAADLDTSVKRDAVRLAAQPAEAGANPDLAARVAEFERVNREVDELAKLPAYKGVDVDKIPGLSEREGRLDEIVQEMYDVPVESRADVLAFSRFLTCPWLEECQEEAAHLGYKLADDVLRLHGAGTIAASATSARAPIAGDRHTPEQAAALDFRPWPDPCEIPADAEAFLGPHLNTLRLGWGVCNKTKAELVAGMSSAIDAGRGRAFGALLASLGSTGELLDQLRNVATTAGMRLYVACTVVSLDPRYADLDTDPLGLMQDEDDGDTPVPAASAA